MGGSPLVYLIVFAGVTGAFVVVGVLVQRMKSPRHVDRWQTGKQRSEIGPIEVKPIKKVKKPKEVGESLTGRMAKGLGTVWRLGDTSQSRLQELLVHAGIREKGAVEVFLGAKFAMALAMPAVAIAYFIWRANVTDLGLNYRHLFMASAMALVAGLMLPQMWLRGKARKRVESIRFALPDMLDLLIVCVESGLGLDAALIRISREMQEVAPNLAEDLVLLNLEISAGKPREECLRNLALRSGCDELESLTARINQASKYGTNLGDSLRIHSESLRQKRRQEAEERAAKTSVKLLFPLVFCIFPAIFVVILGPAVVKIVDMFFK